MKEWFQRNAKAVAAFVVSEIAGQVTAENIQQLRVLAQSFVAAAIVWLVKNREVWNAKSTRNTSGFDAAGPDGDVG